MTARGEPWWSSSADPGDDAREMDGDGRLGGAHPGEHVPEVCGVCPICVGARLLQDGRPELYAHLSEAARHLAAAVRTLLDERVDHRESATADEHLTRIDLD